MRLTRKGKILHNLLLALLLWGLGWALLGFPAYTAQGMCRQMARTLLLPELQPVLYQQFKPRSRMNEKESCHLVLARSGETYVGFCYAQRGLRSGLDYRRPVKMDHGAVALPFRGTLYLAGDFAQAEGAELCMRIQPVSQYLDAEGEVVETVYAEERQLRFAGEKAGEELFTFRYRDDSLWPEDGPLWFLPDHETPERAEEPEVLIDDYRVYVEGSSGGGWLHADIPLEVRLYDGEGRLLRTLNFQADTYEFDNR